MSRGVVVGMSANLSIQRGKNSAPVVQKQGVRQGGCSVPVLYIRTIVMQIHKSKLSKKTMQVREKEPGAH